MYGIDTEKWIKVWLSTTHRVYNLQSTNLGLFMDNVTNKTRELVCRHPKSPQCAHPLNARYLLKLWAFLPLFDHTVFLWLWTMVARLFTIGHFWGQVWQKKFKMVHI